MSINHLVLIINKWTSLMQHKQDVSLVENEKLPLNLFLPNLPCILKIHLIQIISLKQYLAYIPKRTSKVHSSIE